jgi:hypothetical protein
MVEVLIGRTDDPVSFMVKMTKTALDRLGDFDPRKSAYKRGKDPQTYKSGGLVFSDSEGEVLFSIPVGDIGSVHDAILEHFNFKPCKKFPHGKSDASYPARHAMIVLDIRELQAA